MLRTLRRVVSIAFLFLFVLGALQAAVQVQSSLMTMPKPSGCNPSPPAYTSFQTTDTVAYLWFAVLNVNAGDVFASNYYTPTGQYYAPPSGAFSPIGQAGNYCLTDSPFYIAGNTPATMPGTWTVKVTYNGAPLFTLTFTIAVPTPTISNLSPSSAMAGGPAFTLTVNGTNFVSGAIVQWSGNPLSTSYVSATQVTAQVPASQIASQGSASVTVINPAGPTSNALTFPITANAVQVTSGMTKPQSPQPPNLCSNPTPATTAFSATDTAAILWFYVASANAGDVYAANYYTPTGQFYTEGSYTWSPVPTGATSVCNMNWFYIAGHTPASMPGSWTVKVTRNNTPLFQITFTITAASSTSAATVSSLSPNPAVAGGPAFTLTVNGTGFVSGATVQWNGSPLSTTFVSSTQLTASVPAYLIAAQGSANIAVQNPGTALSNTVALMISGTPAATKLLPQFVFGGGWYSALYFTNTTGSAVSFPLSFVGDDGNPMSVPAAGGSSMTVNIPAHGTQMIEALNNGPLNQGYARFSPPQGVIGYGVFRQSSDGRDDQEAVVPFSNSTVTASTLIWDETAFTTAVALVNPNPAGIVVKIAVHDSSGQLLGNATVSLAAGAHTAVVLRNQPGLGAMSGGRGSADLSVDSGNIAVLGLRFGGAAFTSIPTSDK